MVEAFRSSKEMAIYSGTMLWPWLMVSVKENIQVNEDYNTLGKTDIAPEKWWSGVYSSIFLKKKVHGLVATDCTKIQRIYRLRKDCIEIGNGAASWGCAL